MSTDVINHYDRDALRDRFQNAEPFPHLVFESFLNPDLAARCAREYPSYESAKKVGREFGAMNERLKVQVCDTAQFEPAVMSLNAALASPEFLADLEHISGISGLIADPLLAGGGMHVMGGNGGRLDVHVDFNYLEDRKWHRRLNLLVYMNPDWKEEWGGAVELWNQDVSKCYQSVAPVLNRCVIFQTNEISYHGVTPLTAPPGMTRNSFATYYYTEEAPSGWDGTKHSTVFRGRPNEKLREHVLKPAEELKKFAQQKQQGLARAVRSLLKK